MDSLLGLIEASAPAQFLRFSRWGYAGVNAAHILGIALLVGAVVPLNFRLLGWQTFVSHQTALRLLVPFAAAGLALAAAAGMALFAVRATEYAQLGIFLAKMGFVATGTVSAVAAHLRHGLAMADASRATLRTHAFVSLAAWIGALSCGRLIAFATG